MCNESGTRFGARSGIRSGSRSGTRNGHITGTRSGSRSGTIFDIKFCNKSMPDVVPPMLHVVLDSAPVVSPDLVQGRIRDV